MVCDGFEMFIGRSSWPVVKRIVRGKGDSDEEDKLMVACLCTIAVKSGVRKQC